jgi:secreted trypsin-like serine protease
MKIPRLVFLVALLIWFETRSVAGEIDSSNENRGMGGSEAQPGSWPWQVFIIASWDKENRSAACGGSLISDKWVLTAAHCIFEGPSEVVVIAGNVDRTQGELFRASGIFIHPEYHDEPIVNDIALIKLNRSYEKGRPFITLPTAKADKYLTAPGTTAVVTGWGATLDPEYLQLLLQKSPGQEYLPPQELDEIRIPRLLRQVEISILDPLKCSDAYLSKGLPPPTDDPLCAGAVGKGPCHGDSGGPLVVKFRKRYVQVGIVSYARNCGDPALYAVFTRVSKYIDWIKDTLGRN